MKSILLTFRSSSSFLIFSPGPSRIISRVFSSMYRMLTKRVFAGRMSRIFSAHSITMIPPP